MNGLFIGLSTLDVIYLTSQVPGSNEKIVALDQTIAAGGPATNAAVTFRYLGNQSTLVSVIGNHPISQLICAELNHYSINIVDLSPLRLESPAVSSIFVTQTTGERAAISINATKMQATTQQLPEELLHGFDIILIDGHQITVSYALALQAKGYEIPVVIDGGSWKPGFERVLPFGDYVICSDKFYPPNCKTQEDVLSYLRSLDIPYIAITQEDKPIIYVEKGKRGQIDITPIKAVDTLGSGDILHGAFCHYILHHNFKDALAYAAKIASYSCQFFGTRQWMIN